MRERELPHVADDQIESQCNDDEDARNDEQMQIVGVAHHQRDRQQEKGDACGGETSPGTVKHV